MKQRNCIGKNWVNETNFSVHGQYHLTHEMLKMMDSLKERRA